MFLFDDNTSIEELAEIEEAKRIKGNEYKFYSFDLDNGLNINRKRTKDEYNHNSYSSISTISTGSGGILDGEAQAHIENIDIEKEKALLESKNIISEYAQYISITTEKSMQKIINGERGTTNTLFGYAMEDLAYYTQVVGLPEEKAEELILSDYFGLEQITDYISRYGGVNFENLSKADQNSKLQDVVKHTLKFRLNYVNRITSIMADMIKSNYKTLGLSEQEAELYISNLMSGTNTSVKTVGDLKKIIKDRGEQFLINDGEAIDLRPLGFGVIFGQKEDMGFKNIGTNSNQDAMWKYIQQAMRYDAIVLAHGGDHTQLIRSAETTSSLKNKRFIVNFLNEFPSVLEKEAKNKLRSKDQIEIYNAAKSCSIEYSINDQIKNDVYELVSDTKFQDKIVGLVSDPKFDKKETAKYISQIIAQMTKKYSDDALKSDDFQEQLKGKSIDWDRYVFGGDPSTYSNFDYEKEKYSNPVKFAISEHIGSIIAEELVYQIGVVFDSKIEMGIKIATADKKKYWGCVPTRTLKGGPFREVNELVRQLIKEGFKKILVLSCNPGHYELASDIMKTKGVLINHSSNSNIVESSFIEIGSNDIYYNEILELEQSLREMASSYGIDYDDDQYLNECYEWYQNGMEAINEGIGHVLWEFFKKVVAAIINFFKRIIGFFKNLILKVKDLFMGTSSARKDVTTEFPKIVASIIDAKKRDIVEIEGKNRAELKDKADKVNSSISYEIKQFKANQDKNIKRIEQDVKRLEREAQQLKESTKIDYFSNTAFMESLIMNNNRGGGQLNESFSMRFSEVIGCLKHIKATDEYNYDEVKKLYRYLLDHCRDITDVFWVKKEIQMDIALYEKQTLKIEKYMQDKKKNKNVIPNRVRKRIENGENILAANKSFLKWMHSLLNEAEEKSKKFKKEKKYLRV